MLQNSPPSIMVAQNTIRDILNDNQPVPVTIDRIISEVGRTFGVSCGYPLQQAQCQYFQRAADQRLCGAEITQISMQAIGEEFGGRDHSTMVTPYSRWKNMAKDPHKETVEDIIKISAPTSGATFHIQHSTVFSILNPLLFLLRFSTGFFTFFPLSTPTYSRLSTPNIYFPPPGFSFPVLSRVSTCCFSLL